MKKYILTTLLWIIGMTAFTSANTIDNFTSNSEICKNSFSQLWLNEYTYFDYIDCEWIVDIEENSIYLCIKSNITPFYASIDNLVSWEISEEITCFNNPMESPFWNNVISSSSNWEIWNNWYVYFSNSPITYSSNNWWWTSTSNWQLIPWWTATFTPIITRLWSIAWEFIPYLMYIALWALGIALAYKAVKYIISYLSWKAKGAVRWR